MDVALSAEEISLLEQIKTDLDEMGNHRSKLIPILQLVQRKLAYLPAEAIHLVADHLNISSSEVFGVATFYNQFRFNPPGRNPVKVCLGTACHVKGGDIILENFERKLEIREGETTTAITPGHRDDEAEVGANEVIAHLERAAVVQEHPGQVVRERLASRIERQPTDGRAGPLVLSELTDLGDGQLERIAIAVDGAKLDRQLGSRLAKRLSCRLGSLLTSRGGGATDGAEIGGLFQLALDQSQDEVSR